MLIFVQCPSSRLTYATLTRLVYSFNNNNKYKENTVVYLQHITVK